MTGARWARLREILEEALALDPDQRPDFLDRQCAGDPELRREIQELLDCEPRADVLLPVEKWREQAANTPSSLGPEARLGAYRLTAELGRGGMGTVYDAERDDGEYRQRVAIKVIQCGAWEDHLIRRFRQERQILAKLNHPAIARLMDGGVTEDGRPYLVMEFVEGQPITRYCDQQKLGIRERIALFVKICEAVQTAHQALIVHRDLKPANILVASDGNAKLLDFGIAKLLDEEGAAGDSNATIPFLTPRYASPEQVRGEPAGVASDVYSLGTLLYELLAGNPPLALEGLPYLEQARIICDDSPALASLNSGSGEQAALRRTTPNALRRLLNGDLDTILAKALHKDPQRRYATVEAFAADLGRYLNAMPVRARHDSLGYRAWKFAWRRKWWIMATAVMALVIVISGTLVWQSQVMASRQRALAASRFQDVRQLAGSYVYEIDDALAPVVGSTLVRKLVNERALQYLDRLSQGASDNISLQRELAGAYEKLSLVQGAVMSANVGDRLGADASMEKALALRQKILQANPTSPVDRGSLVKTLCLLGRMALSDGDPIRARDLHLKAVEESQPLIALGPKARDAYWIAGTALYFLGIDYGGTGGSAHLGDFQAAAEYHQQVFKYLDPWSEFNKNNPLDQNSRVLVEQILGVDYINLHQYQDARLHLDRALGIVKALGTKMLGSSDRRTWSTVRYLYALALVESGDPQAALPYLYEVLPYSISIQQADQSNVRASADLAGIEALLGRVRVLTGNPTAGFKHLHQAIADEERMLQHDAGWGDLRAALALHYRWTADCAVQVGNLAEARQRYQESENLATATYAAHPADVNARDAIAVARRGLESLRTGKAPLSTVTSDAP